MFDFFSPLRLILIQWVAGVIAVSVAYLCVLVLGGNMTDIYQGTVIDSNGKEMVSYTVQSRNQSDAERLVEQYFKRDYPNLNMEFFVNVELIWGEE